MNVPAVIKTASLDEIKKSASKYKVVFMPRIISVKTNVLKREERNSQYQSGVDRKPNPDYEINRIEAYRAQSELANIRFNGLTMTGWAKLANAFLEGAAQVSATQKLQSLSATPQYIEIPIFQFFDFLS
jgi:hypothetical protein